MNDVVRLIARVEDCLADGGNLLLMTDYDGTLTPIVDEPAHARLPREVHDDLCALARSPRVRVAVISGRDLTDLQTRVSAPGIIYAGCHGLDIEGPGLRFTHPRAEAQRALIAEVTEELRRRAPAVEGMRVESKRLAVAVHYRHATPAARRQVEDELARAIAKDGALLKIFHGKRVIEVLPHVCWNKGHCASWIFRRTRRVLAPPLVTLYLGDDWTDECVFEALGDRAITVSVGRDWPASCAAYRLRSVREVQQLLSFIAAQVGRVGGAA